jgi:four helix bundle protein
MNDFNTKYVERTFDFASDLYRFLYRANGNEASRVITKQVLRSGTSVAANFRAATRARSSREFYSKLCIVVEECDETCFWLDFIKGLPGFPKDHLEELAREGTELLKIFSKARKTMKEKNSQG